MKAAKDLGSDDWDVREAAAREIADAGEGARNMLEELVLSKDPEVSARASILLKQITPEIPAPAPPINYTRQ